MEYLVLDVGGSAIKYALMNDELEFLEKGQVPTPKTSLEDFKKEVQNLYQKYQERVDGIAMSLPGLINKKTNKMQIPGALLYNQDVDILKELKSVTTDRLTIENDAKCAALCEVVYGSLKDSQVGAVCIIGTGIGGGISKQPILLEYLQKSLDKIYQSIDVPIPQVNIVRCKYDNDSNLIGALANYKKIYNC